MKWPLETASLGLIMASLRRVCHIGEDYQDAPTIDSYFCRRRCRFHLGASYDAISCALLSAKNRKLNEQLLRLVIIINRLLECAFLRSLPGAANKMFT